MTFSPIPNWKGTEESHEAYKTFSQFHFYTTWLQCYLISTLGAKWVLPFYKHDWIRYQYDIRQ